MKLGIVGKGGTGKTTVSALLSQAYAQRGARVMAIDTDSTPNLGISLGLPPSEAAAARELPRRLMVGGGDDGADVDGLLREYGVATPAGPTLLTAMRVNEAGAGCTCGSHATVRSLLGEALGAHADVTVIDMEAGLEHLSRAGGTLAHADVLVAVMEPSRKSVITAARIVTLADELGIDRVLGLGTKARSEGDELFFRDACAEHGVELAAVLPYDDAVVAADQAGVAAVSAESAELRENLNRLVGFLDAVPAR